MPAQGEAEDVLEEVAATRLQGMLRRRSYARYRRWVDQERRRDEEIAARAAAGRTIALALHAAARRRQQRRRGVEELLEEVAAELGSGRQGLLERHIAMAEVQRQYEAAEPPGEPPPSPYPHPRRWQVRAVEHSRTTGGIRRARLTLTPEEPAPAQPTRREDLHFLRDLIETVQDARPDLVSEGEYLRAQNVLRNLFREGDLEAEDPADDAEIVLMPWARGRLASLEAVRRVREAELAARAATWAPAAWEPPTAAEMASWRGEMAGWRAPEAAGFEASGTTR